MSKIEEMALKDLPIRVSGNGWNDWDENKAKREGYILGANAVLKEIEKLVSKFDTHPGYQYNDLYTRMKNKILELKGE